MVTPLALVDLLSVLPFYLPFVGVDLRSLRAVRLFRVFRIVKLGRYSKALNLLGRVLVSRKAELVMTIFALLVLMVLASSLMYFAEHDAQPESFSSIPAAMWWAVATLSTVGYGDIYPVTFAGKLLAAVVAVLGIGMFALPAGLLGSAFVEEIQRTPTGPQRCPHCGEELSEKGQDSSRDVKRNR
jgi:voltage-gated potassium channel